jgi:addiction module HigA family antidote
LNAAVWFLLGLLITALLLRAFLTPIRAGSPLIGQSYFAEPLLSGPIQDRKTLKSLITTERQAMATNRMRPIHPGEILREEFLGAVGISANALAMALHVPAPRINDIVRERRAVTPDTALRLARYFNTTAQFWLNLQSSFDLKRAEREAGSRISREVRPLEEAA